MQVGATTIVQMHNELKPVTPDISMAGDTTNVGLWAAQCRASIAGIGVTAFRGFRRKKNSKESEKYEIENHHRNCAGSVHRSRACIPVYPE